MQAGPAVLTVKIRIEVGPFFYFSDVRDIL